MSVDVFISYSGQEGGQFAESLYKQLNGLGIQTFLDGFSIEAGQDWREQILQSVRSSTFLIFVATKESCKSASANQEIGMALAQGKEIIPILVGETEPEMLPSFIQTKQAVKAGSEKVWQAVSKIQEKLKPKLKTISTKEIVIYTAVLAGAIALVFFLLRNK